MSRKKRRRLNLRLGTWISKLLLGLRVASVLLMILFFACWIWLVMVLTGSDLDDLWED